MPRKNPDTSLAAAKSFTEPMKQTHYNKIIEALKVLGVCNYETIGDYLGMRNNVQIARRLKEMMPPSIDNPKGLNLIFQIGSKSPTKSGRMAYNYQLTGTQPKTDNETKTEKPLKGKSVSDYSKTLIKQPTLFKT